METNHLETLYEERRKRVETACNLQEPDRVPILSQVNVMAIGYAGHTLEEVLNDRDLERECYKKALTDFYCDTVVGFGVNYPYHIFMEEGTHTYQVAENGYTVQHKESSSMTFEEYDELFRDPARFFADKIAYRKIDGLQKAYPESYQTLETLYKALDAHKKNNAFNRNFAKTELGLPLLARNAAAHPLDNFFDFIRGFKNTLVDIRRHPDLVMRAIEVLTPFYESTIPSEKCAEEFPYVRNTAHIPTFLSPRQFEKFYWPYVKWAANRCHEMGTKYMIFCEGTWEPYFELFADLPKGSVVAVLESDDVVRIKKKYGHFMTIAGGYTQALLKYGTKEECIDRAKYVIDECAPGGGYLFTGDKSFIAAEDINYENYRAITEFAHEYGKH